MSNSSLKTGEDQQLENPHSPSEPSVLVQQQQNLQQQNHIPVKTPNTRQQQKHLHFGTLSFETDSLPDFSEFEEESLTDHNKAVNKRRESAEGEGKMAPTQTIETITISRPLKVIAFICGFFACILLVMGLASSEWLITTDYRQGLFVYCVGRDATSVPFAQPKTPEAAEGCHRINLDRQGYTVVAAGFVAASLLINTFATFLTTLGLRCRDPNKKYKYYRIAVYVMALALVTVLVALVVYPVCFAQILPSSGRPRWEFGWAYGVSWGASIFLFGGIILLLCDKETEEIYYKERTIVQYADSNNKA